MRLNWIKLAVAITLILLPIAYWWYTTTPPREITFAIGPQFGRYTQVMENLRDRVLQELRIKVHMIETGGSVENLRLVQEGIADFALYQSGTERFLDGTVGIFDQLDEDKDSRLSLEEFQKHRETESSRRAFNRLNSDENDSLSFEEFSNVPAEVRFVANTHSDVAHLVVRSEIESVHDLIAPAGGEEAGEEAPRTRTPNRISVGHPLSGDYAVSNFLLKSLQRSYPRHDVQPQSCRYSEVTGLLDEKKINGAFIMAGVGATIFDDLFDADSEYKLLPIPFAAARARDKVPVYEYTILAGQHRAGRDPIPPGDIESIALRAQLLTASHVKSVVVKSITEIVLSHDFMQQNNLGELIDGGREFARKNPEFPVHAGAWKVYDPDPHPLLPTEFVESWEGIRSFTVSFIIAGFFALRWFRDRQRKRTEHRLDRYIRALLDIERRQVPLDQDTGRDDLKQLQELLDEVTALRLDALGEISAHELNEDHGAACFVDMCHELSSKINAKLTRQTFERQFARLADTLGRNEPGPSPKDHQKEER